MNYCQDRVVIWKDGVKCSRLHTRYCPQTGNIKYRSTGWKQESSRQESSRLQWVVRDKYHAVVRKKNTAMRYKI